VANPTEDPQAGVRIGLISDTHGQLRPQVLEQFAGVAHILHAGDIGVPDILDELSLLAPVTGVAGNTDGFEVRARVPEEAHVELAGRRIVVVHGHQLGVPTPSGLLAAYPLADIIVFGHTHKPAVERVGDRLAVNPGAAGPARFRLQPSVAVLTVTPAEVSVRLIEL
jgi:putative phosphoesterase